MTAEPYYLLLPLQKWVEPNDRKKEINLILLKFCISVLLINKATHCDKQLELTISLQQFYLEVKSQYIKCLVCALSHNLEPSKENELTHISTQ